MINTEAMDPAFYQWGKHESNQEVILNSLNAISLQNSMSLRLEFCLPFVGSPGERLDTREEKPP